MEISLYDNGSEVGTFDDYDISPRDIFVGNVFDGIEIVKIYYCDKYEANLEIRYVTEVEEKVDEEKETITDQQLLNAIANLNTVYNTDNYLEIYHLRNFLSYIPRQELDIRLFALQSKGLLNICLLCHAENYTPEQYDEGIGLDMGYDAPLFFLELTNI